VTALACLRKCHDLLGPSAQTICSDHLHRPSARTIGSDHLLGPSAQTICSDHLLRPSARTICSDHLLRPSARTICSDHLLGPSAQTKMFLRTSPTTPCLNSQHPKSFKFLRKLEMSFDAFCYAKQSHHFYGMKPASPPHTNG
jgi:hypothetical protein